MVDFASAIRARGSDSPPSCNVVFFAPTQKPPRTLQEGAAHDDRCHRVGRRRRRASVHSGHAPGGSLHSIRAGRHLEGDRGQAGNGDNSDRSNRSDEYKELTPTQFMVFQVAAESAHTMIWAHGGTYTLAGGTYTENIQYGFGQPYSVVSGKSF